MLPTSNLSNSDKASRSLKGLLMDKGLGSCDQKLRIILNKMESVQSAMVELVALQKASREASRCECIDLYLASNLKPENAKRNRRINITKLTIFETKAAPSIEWRTRTEFAREYGHSLTSRVFPFKTNHKHYAQVRSFVERIDPNYYQTLCAYETARVSLNSALKALRKIALDIQSVIEESSGINQDLFGRDTDKLSRRIIRQCDKNDDIQNILSGLYAL